MKLSEFHFRWTSFLQKPFSQMKIHAPKTNCIVSIQSCKQFLRYGASLEDLKKILSLNKGKKISSIGSYNANINAITQQLEEIWAVARGFSSTYAEDYTKLNDEAVAWKDKYTVCCIDNSSNSYLFPDQPVPDYITWIRSGELHYLPLELRRKLKEGLWYSVPALFLPTDILIMAYGLFLEPTDTMTEAIAFLAWLPKKEVEDFFAELAWQETIQTGST